jgi:hypothetical protein
MINFYSKIKAYIFRQGIYEKKITLESGRTLTLITIRDTAGQKEYNNIRPSRVQF